MMSFMNGPFSSSGLGYIPEMEQIISQLERGTLVTKFSHRKKPETKTMQIRRETREIVYRKTTATSPKQPYEGAIEIREIKEVRRGKNSKDFEKWPDDSKKYDGMRCFVVFYGSEFKLRVLSIAGKNTKNHLFMLPVIILDHFIFIF